MDYVGSIICNLWHLVDWDNSGLLIYVSKIIGYYISYFYKDFSFFRDKTFFFLSVVNSDTNTKVN